MDPCSCAVVFLNTSYLGTSFKILPIKLFMCCVGQTPSTDSFVVHSLLDE